MQIHKGNSLLILAAGDAVVLALVTLVGFARHGELSSAGLRVLSTFIPLCVAWALVAPWVGVFNSDYTADPRQLWRPLLAVLFAAPLAGWLRGFWLDASVLPIFVLVLAAFSGLGILIWRSLWLILVRQTGANG